MRGHVIALTGVYVVRVSLCQPRRCVGVGVPTCVHLCPHGGVRYGAVCMPTRLSARAAVVDMSASTGAAVVGQLIRAEG